MGGVAIARTLDEARQRLADMLIFCDPTAPATADIIAFHRGRAVEDYDGTAGDIFAQVNTGTPRPHRHRPTHSTTGHRGAVSVMCLTLTNATAIIDHQPSPTARRPRLHPHLAPRRRTLPRRPLATRPRPGPAHRDRGAPHPQPRPAPARRSGHRGRPTVPSVD